MNKKHNFDEQIKAKLDGLQSSPLYGSWDSFIEKMDVTTSESGITDHDFDAKVQDKIHKLRPAYQSGHWEKLRYKLETIELFRRKILLHKAKELVAVFLFLFTFYNVTVHQNNWIQDHSKIYVSSESLPKSQDLIHKEAIADQINSIKGAQDGILAAKQINLVERIKDKNSFRKPISSRVASELAPLSKDDSEKIETLISEVAEINNGSHSSQVNVPQDYLNETIRVTSLSTPQPETYSVYATIIPMNIAKSRVRKNLNRLGIQVAQVDNFILSPFDKVYSVPRFSNSTRNQSYGITYGKKRNRWELEAGLSYSRLSYKPAEVREIYGNTGEISFETSLQKIQFDIWKLPVSMKYFFVDKKSWKYYSLLGTSLNIISEADYTIEENIVLSRPFAPVQFTQDGPRLEEKPFTTGFFNDGRLEGNYYVDVFFGMGVEMSISKFTSVYLQPGYHAFLFSEGIGVGPNNDKINAFQLQTGVKFHFAD